MSSSLLHPPAHLPPAVALKLSQQAPALLRNTPSSISSYSISSLFSTAESAELWTNYENLMLSCLRTGDEQSASICLERLTNRFGAENERVMALRGLFQEAIAEDDAALQKVLKEYENILKKDPTNMVSISAAGSSGLLLTASLAYIKTPHRTSPSTQQDPRSCNGAQPVSRIITYRCGSLGGVGRPIRRSGHVPAGDIRSRGGPSHYPECMECS